jgi:hypothetical protein
MSEPVMKRQPMIDLEEFERRLRLPLSTNATHREPLAELIHLFSDQENHDAGESAAFEPQEQHSTETRDEELSAAAQPEARTPLIGGDFAAIEKALLSAHPPARPIATEDAPEELSPEAEAQAPIIGGDFAAIETALLGALQQPAARMLWATTDAPFAPVILDTSDHMLDMNETAASERIGGADVQIRSRIPLYLMAAIIVAGIAGIAGLAANPGLKRAASGEPQLANVSTPQPLDGAEVNAADVANSGPADSGAAQPGAAQAVASAPVGGRGQEKPPRVIALSEQVAPMESPAPIDTSSILAPPSAQTQTQSLTTPIEGAAAVEPKKVKTAAVRPDGSLISQSSQAQDSLPKDTVTNNSTQKASSPKNAAAKAAPRSAVALKAPAPNAATRAAAQKPAATAELNGSGHHLAGAARAKPVGAADANPPAQPVDGAATPNPPVQKQAAATGPLAFVDTAVNSITGATTKLLDWGHTATSHN